MQRQQITSNQSVRRLASSSDRKLAIGRGGIGVVKASKTFEDDLGPPTGRGAKIEDPEGGPGGRPGGAGEDAELLVELDELVCRPGYIGRLSAGATLRFPIRIRLRSAQEPLRLVTLFAPCS